MAIITSTGTVTGIEVCMASCAANFPIITPPPMWVEQSPATITRGVHGLPIVGDNASTIALRIASGDPPPSSVNAAAEAAFRAARDLGPGDDLKAAGFWFEDGRFRLPDSFGLAPEGLLLRFDPYEVAPYALGETDFVVPRAALAGLVKDPGLLP